MINYKYLQVTFQKCRYLTLLHWNRGSKCILCEEEEVISKSKSTKVKVHNILNVMLRLYDLFLSEFECISQQLRKRK